MSSPISKDPFYKSHSFHNNVFATKNIIYSILLWYVLRKKIGHICKHYSYNFQGENEKIVYFNHNY